MNCPSCHAEAHPLTIQGSQFHQCGGCRGIWVVRDQLERVVGAPLPNVLSEPVSVQMATHSGGRILELGAGFDCPSCKQGLHELAFVSAPDLRIAACSLCFGVFLTAEQLARLQKLAPTIRRAKVRDLDKPLSADRSSLQKSLREASPEEQQQAINNAIAQFERHSRRSFGCVVVFGGGLLVAGGLHVVLQVVLSH